MWSGLRNKKYKFQSYLHKISVKCLLHNQFLCKRSSSGHFFSPEMTFSIPETFIKLQDLILYWFQKFRMDTTYMCFGQTQTLSRILVLSIFDAWGNIFLLIYWQVYHSLMASQWIYMKKNDTGYFIYSSIDIFWKFCRLRVFLLAL